MIWYDEITTAKILEILENHPEWYTIDEQGLYSGTGEVPEELENFFEFLNEQHKFEDILSSVFGKKYDDK